MTFDALPPSPTSIVRPRSKIDPLDAAIDHFVQMCLHLRKDDGDGDDGTFLLGLAHKMNMKASQLRKRAMGEHPNDPSLFTNNCRSLVISHSNASTNEEETTIMFRPARSNSRLLHEARYSMPLYENFIVAANVYAEDQGIDCRNLKFLNEDGQEYAPSSSLKELGFTDDKQMVHVDLNITKVEEVEEVQELEAEMEQ